MFSELRREHWALVISQEQLATIYDNKIIIRQKYICHDTHPTLHFFSSKHHVYVVATPRQREKKKEEEKVANPVVLKYLRAMPAR